MMVYIEETGCSLAERFGKHRHDMKSRPENNKLARTVRGRFQNTKMQGLGESCKGSGVVIHDGELKLNQKMHLNGLLLLYEGGYLGEGTSLEDRMDTIICCLLGGICSCDIEINNRNSFSTKKAAKTKTTPANNIEHPHQILDQRH